MVLQKSLKVTETCRRLTALEHSVDETLQRETGKIVNLKFKNRLAKRGRVHELHVAEFLSFGGLSTKPPVRLVLDVLVVVVSYRKFQLWNVQSCTSPKSERPRTGLSNGNCLGIARRVIGIGRHRSFRKVIVIFLLANYNVDKFKRNVRPSG
jgi:hypothetical protein